MGNKAYTGETERTFMNVRELRRFLADELDYPVEKATVVEEVGDATVDAPGRPESARLGAVLGTLGDETYGSADQLYEAVYGTLSDDHVGRKYYDDRSGAGGSQGDDPRGEGDVSF